MGNTLSITTSTAAAIPSSSAIITQELEAARRLFAANNMFFSPITTNKLRNALVASSPSTTSSISPLLLQARHSYANFMLKDESLKLALPHSLFMLNSESAALLSSSQTATSQTSSSFLKNLLFSILEKIKNTANQVSSLLVQLATFALRNPRLILAGSVGLAAVAGLGYFLVVKQDVLSRHASSTNQNDNDEEEEMMFSELEKKLIRQKIQAQSDLHNQAGGFCPIENEKRNAHLSLFCPITQELFDDPVFVTSSGHTFERSAIMQWIMNAEEKGETAVCPMSRTPISKNDLVSNVALKQAVEDHVMREQQQQKQQKEDVLD